MIPKSKTTAQKIYDLVSKMPLKKQKRILDSLSHDCPNAHVPNERTIAAIKEPKFTYGKSKNVEVMIREMLEETNE